MDQEIQNKTIKFFSSFPLVEFNKGELIIQPEDEVNTTYFINQGNVREYAISPQGTEISIHIFTQYAFFPMTAIIGNISNRYYFEALVDSHIYTVPKKDILDFLHKEPLVLFDLTKRLLMGLDKLSARVESLTYAKSDVKIASILLFLARHFGEQQKNKIFVRTTFTHQDIAALSGMSRETASREWEKLQKQGIIDYDSHHIVILDLSALKKKLS